ncbi:MAG: LCP family protein, partial [Propionibacteriaceae bacterium]|nr:LCP family protein [Propionibacteriaceae bacterium]
PTPRFAADGADPTPPGRAARNLMVAGKALAVICLAAVAYTVWSVARSGILPLWWLVGGVIVALGLAAAVLIGLWRTRLPGHPVRFGLLTGLTALGLALCLGLSHFMYALIDFTHGIQPPPPGTVRYDVIALKTHDPALASLAGAIVGRLSNDPNQEVVATALAAAVQVELADLDDPTLLAAVVSDGTVAGAVINDAYLSMYEENDPTFFASIQILHQFDVMPDHPSATPTWSAPPLPVDQPFVLYISGVDSFTEQGRSDVNILAVVNPRSGRILLVSTPRDYYVQLHGTTGRKDKLTHAGFYGVDMSVATLADLYEVKIDYFVRLNFGAMIQLVDAVGGVDVESAHTFTTHDGLFHFEKGWNHLNGDQALAFSRERKSFLSGDRVRGENQERVIEALVRRGSDPAILLRYNAILNSLQGSLQTSMPASMITALANQQLSRRTSWQVETINADGSDAMEYTHSYGGQKLYVMVPDMATVQAARNRIDQLLAE